MMPAPLPEDEEARLALLHRHRLSVTGSEPEFDRIARQAADLFEVPYALVTIVTEHEQRFLGACGLTIKGTERDIAFCGYTILGNAPLIVSDATADERFAGNPLVTGPMGLRFYAGAPLMLEQGLSVGALCLLDTRPREFADGDRKRLAALAETVVDLIRLRLGAARSLDLEAAAKQAHRRLTEVVEHIEHGIIVLDSELRLEMFNDNAFRILRLPDTLRRHGTPIEDLLREIARRGELGAGPVEEIVTRRAASFRQKNSLRESLQMEGDRTVEIWRRALPDGSFVNVLTDISEQRRVERMQEEFVSTVSHELRTPLTSILGSVGLLEAGAAGPLDEKARRLLGIARINCDRLSRIINDLLDIGKSEAGKLDLDLRPTDIAAALRQAIDTNAPYAERFDVRLVLDDAPMVTVLVDPHRFQQVMTNLLSNAVKFSPKGETVTISLGRRVDGVRVTVADRGPGIPQGFRDRIFAKFAQADSSDRRGQQGTGLGLSISKRLVDAMGGAISFEAATGDGTRFHVDLPLHRASPSSVPEGAAQAARALLVGRNPVRERLAAALRMSGLEPMTVNDLDEAVRAVTAVDAGRRPAALLLSDGAELGTGAELVREVRRRRDLLAIPLLAILPQAAQDAPAAMSPPVSGAGLPARPVILHVEDDEDLCSVTRAALEPLADVVNAGTLDAARSLIRGRRFDMAILDIGLPDGLGTALIPDLEAGGAGMPVVVFSAYEPDATAADAVSRVLTKSRDSIADMREIVRGLLAAARSGTEEGS